MKMIKVVAALIEKDGKYLIARRADGDSDVLGKWEFPGGKVEENEDEMHAIKREIKEEFEIDIKPIRFITNNVFKYPSKIVDLRLYECRYVSGEFKLHNHYEYKFVSKDEIINYDLSPADISLAKFIKENM